MFRTTESRIKKMNEGMDNLKVRDVKYYNVLKLYVIIMPELEQYRRSGGFEVSNFEDDKYIICKMVL